MPQPLDFFLASKIFCFYSCSGVRKPYYSNTFIVQDDLVRDHMEDVYSQAEKVSLLLFE